MIKEGHSKIRIFFCLTPIKTLPLTEIRLHRSPKFEIVAAILNSTQQPGRVFVMSFRPIDFA